MMILTGTGGTDRYPNALSDSETLILNVLVGSRDAYHLRLPYHHYLRLPYYHHICLPYHHHPCLLLPCSLHHHSVLLLLSVTKLELT